MSRTYEQITAAYNETGTVVRGGKVELQFDADGDNIARLTVINQVNLPDSTITHERATVLLDRHSLTEVLTRAALLLNDM